MTRQYPNDPVLLVDDEQSVLHSLEMTLNLDGITNTVAVTDSTSVTGMLKEQEFSLVLVDLLMPRLGGMDLLEQIHERYPEIPVIVVTGVNEVKSAVECMKLGAVDYVVKPVEKNELLASVRSALELVEARRELESIKRILFEQSQALPPAYEDIICADKKMTSVIQYLHMVRDSAKPVLITGETGVGKDVIAAAFHKDCALDGPLVTINVAGLDDNMFSDTLFGHKKGAFTGAEAERKGLLHEAQDGMVFLDEIGDLSMASQVKLLRLLQNGEYLPLGAETYRISNARFICATNANLHELIREGKFRKDLFYRLKTHHVQIPSLRERKGDIPLLADHFLEQSAAQLDKPAPTPPRELYPLLRNYSFPGNVRELESMIHEAVSIHTKGILSLDMFKQRITGSVDAHDTAAPVPDLENGIFVPGSGGFPTMEEIERHAIQQAMEQAEGNQSLAGQLLGVSRHTIMRKLKQIE